MPSRAQRSASQYQVKMHSAATTSFSRNGAIAFKKTSGSVARSRWVCVVFDADFVQNVTKPDTFQAPVRGESLQGQ